MDRKTIIIVILILLLLFVILAAIPLAVWYFETRSEKPVPPSVILEQAANGGGRYTFTKFYHANDGEWIINDPETPVLRTQKYVSSRAEMLEYKVKVLGPGARVRIIQPDARWKLVDVIENGKVVATGWIDAHMVKKVHRARDVKPTTSAGDQPGRTRPKGLD